MKETISVHDSQSTDFDSLFGARKQGHAPRPACLWLRKFPSVEAVAVHQSCFFLVLFANKSKKDKKVVASCTSPGLLSVLLQF